MRIRRRVASLALPAVLAPALVGVSSVPQTAAVARAGDLAAPASSAGPEADPLRAAQAEGTDELSRAELQSSTYSDTCRDVGDSPLDLRALDIEADASGGSSYALTVTSCRPWDAADFGAEGSIDIPLITTSSGGEYAIIVDQDAGALRLTVLKDHSTEDVTVVHTTTEFSRPDARTASAEIPFRAFDPEGRQSAFYFLASSLDAQGREDWLPESHLDENGEEKVPPLQYPYSCAVAAQRAATVVVEPARSEGIADLARSRAAQVQSAHPAVLSLDDVSDTALAELRRTPGVRSAERPVVLRRLAAPDDQAYPKQWSLPAIGAPAAWDVRTGSGGVLAVIDDGVDGVRDELAGRVLRGRDTVYDVDLALDSDLGGHGTAVAGLAAANSDNGAGVAGVDWNADVLPYRVFDAAGCATDAAVVAALYAAADHGASVANLSLGGPNSSAALQRAVAEVTARGMLVVAAAGNARGESTAPSYPAAYPEVLAVGATTADGSLAPYSSGGDHLDVVAPGGDLSRTPEGDLLVLGEADTLELQTGTSFAAPLVAAAALLYRAEHPELSPADVAAAVERSAVDAGPPGRDPDYGAGRLDAGALLRLQPEPAPEPSPEPAPEPASQPGSAGGARGTALACPPGEVPEDGFADLPQGAVHEDSVDCVVWWRVANGTANGYQPVGSVTRAQMASFIARLIARSGGTLPAAPPNAFNDDERSVHRLAIDQLAALGVVTGPGGGRYDPDAPVNRAQMATFLVRAYATRTGTELTADRDAFGDDNGTVHEPRINAAAAAGFTGGVSGGGYGPDLPVRRDGMGTFLARVLDLLVADGLTGPPGA